MKRLLVRYSSLLCQWLLFGSCAKHTGPARPSALSPIYRRSYDQRTAKCLVGWQGLYFVCFSLVIIPVLIRDSWPGLEKTVPLQYISLSAPTWHSFTARKWNVPLPITQTHAPYATESQRGVRPGMLPSGGWTHLILVHPPFYLRRRLNPHFLGWDTSLSFKFSICIIVHASL